MNLSQLHWCGKPLMVFHDEGKTSTTEGTGNAPSATATVSSTPTPIHDWATFKRTLGFTVYLPATLPQGSCLMSVSGTTHDMIFGSNFTIGFLLPNHNSLSFSEAPLGPQKKTFQCSPITGNGQKNTSTTSAKNQATVQLCTGVRDKTNIVFSAHGTTNDLQQFFQGLQPDVNWLPGP